MNARERTALLRSRGHDADFVYHDALEVLCRVFDDGADARFQRWLEWYEPKKWLGSARALGGFIAREVGRECAASAIYRAEAALLTGVIESAIQGDDANRYGKLRAGLNALAALGAWAAGGAE